MAVKADCVRYAWRHPVQVIASVMLGFGLLWGVWWWQTLTAPIVPVMVASPSLTRGDDGVWWLRMAFASGSPQRCLRISSAKMTRPLPDGRWEDHTFAGSIGGRTLGGARYDYVVAHPFPASMPPGEYEVWLRYHYQCEPFGMVMWEHTIAAGKVRIP